MDQALSEPMDTAPGAPPPMRLGGTSDPRRAQQGRQRLETQVQQRKTRADQDTRGDFGEQQLAPTRDPVEGLDPSLPGLEIPDFDAQAHVDASFKEGEK